jgi:hydroxyquinol 1,2-dioxygenase
MRNVNSDNITDAVNARLDGCSDARLKQIVGSFTTHFHNFVREVGLTEAEWQAGIEYLTATGKMCNDKRQEFILLSDVLGVSMLTVALNQGAASEATEATVFGPFHVADAPWFQLGDDLSNGAPGSPCFVSGTVRGLDGQPVANALLDVWHADEDGLYDVQYGGAELAGRGRLRTDAQGRFNFRTIKPVAYPVPTDGPVGQMLTAVGRHPWRPAHIHFMLQAEGYQTLVTQVFDRQCTYLDSDAVFGVRSSLVGDYVRHEAGGEYRGAVVDEPFYTLDFTFVLQPA